MVGTLKADDMETDDASGGGVDETTTTIKKNEEEEEEQEEQEEEKVDHKVQLRKLSRAYEVAKGARDSSRQEKAAESIAKEMRTILCENNMVGCYEYFCEKLSWPVDAKELKRMQTFETETMTKIESNLKDAKENLGDDDVQSALREMGDKYAQMGYKEKCVEAYEKCKETNATIGQKMEIEFSKARVGLFWEDLGMWKKSIEEIKKLLEMPGGADWERKNRLKVYEGLWMCASRDFKSASTLFLESLSTFGAYELMSYDEFVFHCAVTGVVTLPRVELNEKVVMAPEIIRASLSTPGLPDFLNSLQRCEYAKFAEAFPLVGDAVDLSPWLSPHSRYFSRECRVRAYAQYLQSYRSVSVPSMAQAFGVSVEFLDEELSRFIVSGRLNCTIDAVEGVLRTNRPDKKNALYQQFVKDGDALLNRIQKLSRVIDL